MTDHDAAKQAAKLEADRRRIAAKHAAVNPDEPRYGWYPIDKQPELEHAAQLADKMVKACEWQAFVDLVDATDSASQWSDRGADHD